VRKRKSWFDPIIGLPVVTIGLSLTGCVAAPASPDFEVPIQWGESRLYEEDGATAQEQVDATIALFADGEAVLRGFPQGVTVEQDDGSLCFEETTPERYDGAATWSARSIHHFELTFGESTVHVFDEGGFFGSQDWAQARIVECGTPVVTWALTVTCGDPGWGTNWDPCVVRLPG
jgi:hypothetical protein